MQDVYRNDIAFFRAKREAVGEAMFGVEAIVNCLMIALLMRGHILLEGNPGLGKTMLVRELSEKLEIGGVGRIQFTPDLMPSDITGTEIPVPTGSGETKSIVLDFKHGPIFCRLLLADEINRATPKTQSALLEAMAEFQCTVLGEVHKLTETHQVSFRDGDEGAAVRDMATTPFLVMATQNPVEQEGTYPLPEAQLDRFLMKARMPFPARDILGRIMAADVRKLPAPSDDDDAKVEGAIGLSEAEQETLGRMARLARCLRGMTPSAGVETHILNMVLASNGDFDGVEGLDPARMKQLQAFHAEKIDYPLGPRAATSLALATLGWAALVSVELTAFDVDANAIQGKSPEALASLSMSRRSPRRDNGRVIHAEAVSTVMNSRFFIPVLIDANGPLS